MIVSALTPKVTLSMLAIVAMLFALAKMSLSSPSPRSIDAVDDCGRQNHRIGRRAADDGFDVDHRHGVGEVAQDQLVVARLKVDGAIDDDGRVGDGICGRVADNRFDIRDGAGVDEGAEVQAVVACAEIDRLSCGERRTEVDRVGQSAAEQRFNVRSQLPC